LKKTNEIQIENPKDIEMVGFIAISIFWRDLVTNLLPPGSDGILIVIDNPCNPTFSFQVNGPDVEYLGRGDFHDPKYDSMEIGVSSQPYSEFRHLPKVSDLQKTSKQSWLPELGSFAQGSKSYTGLPLVNDTCPFYLRLYPSETMETDYKTNDPILFTVCAVLIFAFTSAVFIVYDRLVEKRQKTVMTTAVHTSAIVSSLFPATVRDRLFDADNEHDENRKTAGEQLITFGDKVVSRPIADLYPSATVMFADM
jgi:hypothetical protein